MLVVSALVSWSVIQPGNHGPVTGAVPPAVISGLGPVIHRPLMTGCMATGGVSLSGTARQLPGRQSPQELPELYLAHELLGCSEAVTGLSELYQGPPES